MAKTHKKQHYVPETYLRAWCDPNAPKEQAPYVWLFSKEGETGRAKAPKNIFHETDFYTIKGPSSSRDLTLEKGLSQLERAFSTLRRKTLDRRAKLSFRDTKVLLAFNATMYARSKFQRDHWRSEFSRASEWSGGIITAISEMSPEERQHFLVGMSKLAQPPPDTPQESLLDFHKSVNEATESPMQHILSDLVASTFLESWAFDLAIFTTDTTPGFITSDNPCVMSYVTDRESVDSLRWRYILPLSFRQALVLNAGGVSGYVKVPLQIVKNINRVTRSMASESYVSNRRVLEPSPF